MVESATSAATSRLINKTRGKGLAEAAASKTWPSLLIPLSLAPGREVQRGVGWALHRLLGISKERGKPRLPRS